MEPRGGDSSVKASVGWGHPSVDLGTSSHPPDVGPPPDSPLLDLPQPLLLLGYLPLLPLNVARERP